MMGQVSEPWFFLKAVLYSVFGAQILNHGCSNHSFFIVPPDVYTAVNA
jgi:hypothetical protein